MPHTLGARIALAGLIVALTTGWAGSAAQAPRQAMPVELSALEFRTIGPANMSGRFVDMDVVESDPFRIYVASSTGGTYRSTDNGITWTAVFEREAVHSIGDIAIFQPKPEIVWVGTGERANRQSSSACQTWKRRIDKARTVPSSGAGRATSATRPCCRDTSGVPVRSRPGSAGARRRRR